MTVQCCQCKRVRTEDYWKVPSQPLEGAVSHTYCPVCLPMAKRELMAQVRFVTAK